MVLTSKKAVIPKFPISVAAAMCHLRSHRVSFIFRLGLLIVGTECSVAVRLIDPHRPDWFQYFPFPPSQYIQPRPQLTLTRAASITHVDKIPVRFVRQRGAID